MKCPTVAYTACLFYWTLTSASVQGQSGMSNGELLKNSTSLKAFDTDILKMTNTTTLASNSTRLVLKVVTMREPPYVEYMNISNGSLITKNKTGPGVVIEIMRELKLRLNADLEYHEAEDGAWGEKDQDTGNWSGMIGMLHRKEADILAGAAILRYDRSDAADQSYPFHTSDTGMLIRAPGKFLENRFLIVTAPFQWQVWALTALTIFVSGCIMKALCRALSVAAEVQYTWSEAIWLFFSVFVQQGLPVQPKSWTCRTMLAFWWLAALTLVATFTGNMVALFAVNKAALPFNTQDELLEHVQYEGYRIVTPNNTMTRIRFIQTSLLPVFKDLWYEMSTRHKWINVSSLEDGIRMVRREPKLVLLGPMETLAVYASADCDVATTSNGIIPVMYSIMLQKGSPYSELVSNASRQLVEMGLVAKWLNDYHFQLSAARGNLCIFAEGVSAAGDAIDISRAQGAFWILLGGVILGSSGILLEYFLKLLRLGLKAMGLRKFFPSDHDHDQTDVMRRYHPGEEGMMRGSTKEVGRRAPSEGFKGDNGMPEESARAYQPNNSGNGTKEYGSLKHRRKISERRT